jgi:hypothetical protein
MEFTAGGRFVDNDGDHGDYVINGNTITFNWDNFYPMSFTFRVSGNRLTIDGANPRTRNVLHRR